jgi:hypothetical protein
MSKLKSFRFNESMENDLAALRQCWGTNEAETIAKALSNCLILERAWTMQQTQTNKAPEQKLLEVQQRAPTQATKQATGNADQADNQQGRLQIRIFHAGEKRPFKTFSGVSRVELDARANDWLRSNGYDAELHSVGKSFRFEV